MNRLAIGTAVAVALLVSGCDQKPEKKESEHVSISRDGGKITIQSDNGKAKVEITTGDKGLTAKMPGFVSLYPGAKVQSNMQGAAASGMGGGVIFTAKDAPETVIAFYRDKAKAEGMAETMVMQREGTHIFVATAKAGKRSFHVSAAPGEDGGSQVSLFWSGE